MAFEKMGIFTFNHAEQPDELNVAADIAKANFDSRANELKTVLNKVVDLLNATTDGASGADNVGATAVDGLTGTTVQTILEELKTLVDAKETPTGAQAKANTAEEQAKTYADGQVGDLAGEGRTTETVKGNADAHIAHLADYASFITNNAVAHNSIYRGKYLGSSVTAEQYTAISSGTFTDLYIGDYWTIGGVNYRIAAFDYYYNTGDTACTSHHVVIVPDTQLYAHVMNDTNITTGGYTGSKMYTEGLEQAKTIINTAFSGHVVNHRKYLCNAVTNGAASGGAWFDSEVELMNEVMVYGSIVNGHATYGLYNIGAEKTQLPLFALNPRTVNTRQTYWLRDVSSAASFAYVRHNGRANHYYASSAYGVRPAFSIS
jgi:hypothetical protein